MKLINNLKVKIIERKYKKICKRKTGYYVTGKDAEKITLLWDKFKEIVAKECGISREILFGKKEVV